MRAAARVLLGRCAIAISAIAGSISLSVADEQPLTRFEFEQVRFAAPARLVFYASTEEVANKLSRAVFDRLKQFDRIMSDYDPDSELSKLCETAGSGQAVPVSDELWEVLSASQRFAKETDGAFDVSVGPVVKLWRIARRTKKLPSPDAIREAVSRTGWKSVVLDESKKTVELRLKGMQLDLGGIAQGYAADEGLKILKEGGVTRALVDISGDIRLGDPPPGEQGWKIEIESLKRPGAAAAEKPAAGDGKRLRMLLLSNAAVSTSGDVYQFVEIEGVRYSHIVDPKTGIGLTRSCSVTVIAPDALTADAIDTALCVRGVEQGLETLKKFDRVEALFETVMDGKMEVQMTIGFRRYELDRESQNAN
jgi:FAD:protein FMN transferase